MPVIRLAQGSQRKRPNTTNNFLFRHRNNVYSQSGEDGILAEIFTRIGPKSKWCVEFGAWDGVHLSNTCHLIRDHGWSAVLIEADSDRCERIKTNLPQDDVHAICAMLGFEQGVDTLDDHLASTPIPKEFDLVSIDVDGMDWHLWESMVDYRPRVVLIEFNHLVPNDVVFVQDRNGSLNEGHSLLALIELGKSKGYELVGVAHRNAFFVVQEEFAKFGISDNSIDAMRPFTPSYIWSTYNGKIYNTMPNVRWGINAKEFELKADSLQLFDEYRWRDSFQGRPERATEQGDRVTDSGVSAAEAPQAEDNAKSNAESLLRELLHLRQHRGTMAPEERGRRQREAWSAAAELLDPVSAKLSRRRRPNASVQQAAEL